MRLFQAPLDTFLGSPFFASLSVHGSQFTVYAHWEIKGRFRKRVVLANVPSFRFSFRGNIRQNHPFGNHPFVNTKKGHWEIKGRFPKGWFWRTYPRSGFRSGGTSAETTFWKPPFCQPPIRGFDSPNVWVLIVWAHEDGE